MCIRICIYGSPGSLRLPPGSPGSPGCTSALTCPSASTIGSHDFNSQNVNRRFISSYPYHLISFGGPLLRGPPEDSSEKTGGRPRAPKTPDPKP